MPRSDVPFRDEEQIAVLGTAAIVRTRALDHGGLAAAVLIIDPRAQPLDFAVAASPSIPCAEHTAEDVADRLRTSLSATLTAQPGVVVTYDGDPPIAFLAGQ